MKVTQGLTRKIDGPLAMAADTMRLFGWQMYFIEAHAMDKGAVLTSPSAPYALYVARGQASCFAKVDLPGPALATRAGLEHRSGTTQYEEIERLALARLDKLDLRRGPGDFLPLTAISETLQLPPDGVSEAIRTSAGKDALAALARCSERSCSGEESRAVIDRYRTRSDAPVDTPLFELLLLQMSAHRCAD